MLFIGTAPRRDSRCHSCTLLCAAQMLAWCQTCTSHAVPQDLSFRGSKDGTGSALASPILPPGPDRPSQHTHSSRERLTPVCAQRVLEERDTQQKAVRRTSPPSPSTWPRAAARLKGAAGSTSGRNCRRNVLSTPRAPEFPPASTAAKPNMLQEPPLPGSCTSYFLLRKACLNSHTPREGKETLSACKLKFVKHYWHFSLLYITRGKKSRILID